MPTMRGHNEGSIYQRRTGEWVAAVTMRNGKRATRWSKSRDEAKADLAELLRLRDAGASLTNRVRLGDYLERWVTNDHGWAPSTYRKHESIVRCHLVPSLGHIRLSELRPTDVDLAIRSQSGIGAQSRRHMRATLRRALADGLRDGLLGSNVGALSKAPKLPHAERTILDLAQARTLIESTRETRYGPLWVVLLTTGLRISEALGLRWSDIDFGGGDGSARPGGGDSGWPDRADHDGDLARYGSGRSVRGGVADDARRRDRDRHAGPSLTVRHALQRVNGEWQLRPPKTAKGRRTIPLTPLGVEALRAQRAMQLEDLAAYYGGRDGTSRTGLEARMGGSARGLGDREDRQVVDTNSRLSDLASHRRNGPRRDGERRGADAGGGTGGVGSEVRSRVIPLDGLVFTTDKGNAIHATNLLPPLRRDLEAAGLPRCTIHDLRHSCATVLYAMGIPIETIADILGHSTPRITGELYRHRVPLLQQEAVDALQRALG